MFISYEHSLVSACVFFIVHEFRKADRYLRHYPPFFSSLTEQFLFYIFFLSNQTFENKNNTIIFIIDVFFLFVSISELDR